MPQGPIFQAPILKLFVNGGIFWGGRRKFGLEGSANSLTTARVVPLFYGMPELRRRPRYTKIMPVHPIFSHNFREKRGFMQGYFEIGFSGKKIDILRVESAYHEHFQDCNDYLSVQKTKGEGFSLFGQNLPSEMLSCPVFLLHFLLATW